MADIFVVPSSSGKGSYEIEVSSTPDGIKLFCNCQAGQFGKICKHKLRVVRAALGLDTQEGIVGKLENVSASVNSSKLPALLHQLAELEQAAEEARKKVAKAKKALERHLVNGA